MNKKENKVGSERTVVNSHNLYSKSEQVRGVPKSLVTRQFTEDKSTKKIEQVKIYLASPWFNETQKKRVRKAKEFLNRNDTVRVVHFPFDFQYEGATIDNQDNSFGTPAWVDSTYENDISAMTTSDAGVFLYDFENEDCGSAYELGFMRALHKPTILVAFHSGKINDLEVNLMIAAGVTKVIDEENFDRLVSYDFDHFPSDKKVPFKVF